VAIVHVESWRVLSRVLEDYTENPKIFTVTSSVNPPQQIFLQRDVFTNSYCCPFCGQSKIIDKWEQRWRDWQYSLENALATWGSVVVQEVMDKEGQWVDWLHGHKYWMCPKRMFMLSIRDGVIYPVSPAECKVYHELQGQDLVPSEPLIDYIEPTSVFAFFKIHHIGYNSKIRITN
jgi:hypothetical protein